MYDYSDVIVMQEFGTGISIKDRHGYTIVTMTVFFL